VHWEIKTKIESMEFWMGDPSISISLGACFRPTPQPAITSGQGTRMVNWLLMQKLSSWEFTDNPVNTVFWGGFNVWLGSLASKPDFEALPE